MTLFFMRATGSIVDAGAGTTGGVKLLAYSAPGTNPANTNLVLGHQPIFVMGCDRSASEVHWICDSVRGATKLVNVPTPSAEITDTDSVKSFNADGVTVGPSQYTNLDSRNYRILSIGADSILEIVTYTGTGVARTVSHTGNGIGATPASIWTFPLNITSGAVYHKSLGATKADFLDDNAAANTSAIYWDNTAPTGSEFTVGTSNRVNANGVSYVAYLWYEVAGVSTIDEFVGDASDPGITESTGFSPDFMLFKNPNLARGWLTFDTARNPSNTRNLALRMDVGANESTGFGGYDTVANGVQMRSTSDWLNPSAAQMIYSAFKVS